MPTMQGSVSVAANGVSGNELSGELYEFLPANANLTLSLTGSADGLRATFLVGGVALINDQEINSQNRFPTIPDDIMTQEVAPASARLILTFRNTTAGALTARWRVDVSF